MKNFVVPGKCWTRKQGKRVRELTMEEEERLFESGEFVRQNPEALQCTLCWFFSLHFGFRARDESRKLCWGDLELQNDPEIGKKVLVWIAERGNKTRKGMESAHQRQFNPKIFAEETERCLVRLFKLFEGHRLEKAKAPSYPFFLAITWNHKGWREKPNGWYKLSPLGKNHIGKFLPKAEQKAGLQACGKKIANHSARKTSSTVERASKLNLQSLSSYKSASMTQQGKMSDILQQASWPGLSPNAPNFVSVHVDGTSSQHSLFAQQRNFDFQAMPHLCLFESENIGSISNCTFYFVQSAPSDASVSFHENAGKHKKLESNRWKFSSCCLRSHR